MRVFLRAILIAALSATVATAAEAQCKLPQELDALVIAMQNAVIEGEDLSTLDALRLGLAGTSIDRKEISEALDATRMSAAKDILLGFVGDAVTIGKAGRIEDRRALQARLSRAMEVIEAVCVERHNEIVRQLRIGQRLRKTSGQATPVFPFSIGANEVSGTSFLYLSMLVPAVAGLVLALWLGDRFYHRVLAPALSRKPCAISAALEGGIDVIDGHITRLGYGDCRFQAIDAESHQRVMNLDIADGASILVGHRRLPGRIDGVRSRSVDFAFDEKQGKELIDLLLRSSGKKASYLTKAKNRKHRKGGEGTASLTFGGSLRAKADHLNQKL